MFKKDRDLTERSKTLLKNKEVRTLKAEIVKQFPNVQEEELNSVIPNKADITLTKLANKTLLYSIDGVVLFFDVNARNNLYPALPFLWRFPNALPTFIIYSPVSEFVLRGADLMTPGLCTSLLPEMAKLNLREGSKACVRIVGNPLPFAVGDCLFDTSILSDGVRHKGRALTVHHVYGDLLSTSGVVPNSGFGPSRIYPIETEAAVGELAQHDIPDEGDDSDSEIESGEETSNAHAKTDEQVEDDQQEPQEQSEPVNELAAMNLHDQSEDEAEDASEVELETDQILEAEHGDSNELSVQSKLEQQQGQDALLLQTVLLATKYVIKDKQLPMLVSTYWSLLQRCAVANHNKLDLKLSSYRKVSSFLTHCQALGLLTVQENQGVSTITSLHKTHDLFRGVKVENPELFKSHVLTSTTVSNTTTDSSTSEPVSEFAAFQAAHSVNQSGDKNKKVQVLELFKLTKHLKDIFGVPRGEYGEYLKPGEVRDILVMYIKNQQLENETDHSCLLIPPADGLHSILASYSSANKNKNSTNGTVSASVSSNVSKGDSKAGSEEYGEEGLLEESAYATTNDLYDTDYIDPLDDNYSGNATTSYSSGGLFGNIPLPGSSGDEIKMKVHQGGLRSIDSTNTNTSSNTSTSHTTTNNADYPALGNTHTTAKNTTLTAPLTTPLGVGGWGVDKGSAWKPVTLSTARANTSVQPSKGKTSLDTEFPTLGSSSAHTNQSKKASTSVSKSKSVVYSELPTELNMKKEDVFKAVMKKMSPYFAVISQTGGMTVHSGQIPKAKILVENRMGNKAVTILRGLEVFAIDLAVLTKECQKKFACSAALSTVPGIPKDKEIVIQGNLAFEVESYLCSTKGIPKSLIEIDTAKGAKLKKKK